MDILHLIENRTTARKYRNKKIPAGVVNKIVQAGIWGSAVIGIQPWKFVVITTSLVNKKIANLLLKKAQKLESIRNLSFTTANTIANAPMIILVYNRNSIKSIEHKIFKIKKERIKKDHINIAEKAEIEAISGAIQNMILVAHSLGIGSCWNTLPLFCEKEINRLLKTDDQLLSILTFGYPAEKTKRSPRRPLSETVQFITNKKNV